MPYELTYPSRALPDDLVDWDLAYLAAHPDAPSLASSGVVARTFSLKDEHQFCDIAHALQFGYATAESLAAWRCAEHRRAGVQAKIYLKVKDIPFGGCVVSVYVLLPDGSTEEPFKIAEHDAFTGRVFPDPDDEWEDA